MNRLQYYRLNVAYTALALIVLAWGRSSSGQQLGLFAAVRAQPDAAAQKALQQQIRKTLEPMLKAELSFANRVAKPSDEERRALIAAAVKLLDQFANEFAQKQDRNERQMWLQGMQRVVIGGPRDTEDPHEMIERGVAKLVAEMLPAEKVAAYKKQADLRDAFRRDATVANLVAQLDEKLILAPEQREKITVALTEHWDAKRAPQIESFSLGRNYFLPVPKQWVRPELTAAQQTLFDRLNNSSRQIFFNGMGIRGQGDEFIDDIDLEERPPTADETPAANQPVTADP